MPSGSHSGGSRGGSHSSGGARSSSSYSSSSRSSSSHHHSSGRVGGSWGHHHHHHYHRPVRFWWGRTYVINNSGAASILSVLIGIFLFLTIALVFIGSLTITSVNNDIKYIEADYRYYCDMIDASYSDPTKQVDAIITGKYLSDTCDKYYLTYKIYTTMGSELEGFTYSMYTADEIRGYQIGSVIKCAVDSNPITQRTDSVNLDYKGALDRDGEYIAAKELRKNAIIVIFVFGAIDLMLLVIIVKKVKKNAEEERVAKKTSTSMGAMSKPVSRCPYCGTKAKDGSRKCSNCGASIK